MLRALILVGLGGGLGSILRFLTSAIYNKYFQVVFPWATFTVNILGCLIVGILFGLWGRGQSSDLHFLFITGFCGGYTTFSTFSLESILLYQSGNYLTALLYIIASMVTGMIAVGLGLMCVKGI